MVIKTKTKIKHVNKNKLIKNKIRGGGGLFEGRDYTYTKINIPKPEDYIKDKDTYNLYAKNFAPAIIYLTKADNTKKNIIYEPIETYTEESIETMKGLFDGLSVFDIIHSRVTKLNKYISKNNPNGIEVVDQDFLKYIYLVNNHEDSKDKKVTGGFFFGLGSEGISSKDFIEQNYPTQSYEDSYGLFRFSSKIPHPPLTRDNNAHVNYYTTFIGKITKNINIPNGTVVPEEPNIGKYPPTGSLVNTQYIIDIEAYYHLMPDEYKSDLQHDQRINTKNLQPPLPSPVSPSANPPQKLSANPTQSPSAVTPSSSVSSVSSSSISAPSQTSSYMDSFKRQNSSKTTWGNRYRQYTIFSLPNFAELVSNVGTYEEELSIAAINKLYGYWKNELDSDKNLNKYLKLMPVFPTIEADTPKGVFKISNETKKEGFIKDYNTWYEEYNAFNAFKKLCPTSKKDCEPPTDQYYSTNKYWFDTIYKKKTEDYQKITKETKKYYDDQITETTLFNVKDKTIIDSDINNKLKNWYKGITEEINKGTFQNRSLYQSLIGEIPAPPECNQTYDVHQKWHSKYAKSLQDKHPNYTKEPPAMPPTRTDQELQKYCNDIRTWYDEINKSKKRTFMNRASNFAARFKTSTSSAQVQTPNGTTSGSTSGSVNGLVSVAPNVSQSGPQNGTQISSDVSHSPSAANPVETAPTQIPVASTQIPVAPTGQTTSTIAAAQEKAAKAYESTAKYLDEKGSKAKNFLRKEGSKAKKFLRKEGSKAIKSLKESKTIKSLGEMMSSKEEVKINTAELVTDLNSLKEQLNTIDQISITTTETDPTKLSEDICKQISNKKMLYLPNKNLYKALEKIVPETERNKKIHNKKLFKNGRLSLDIFNSVAHGKIREKKWPPKDQKIALKEELEGNKGSFFNFFSSKKSETNTKNKNKNKNKNKQPNNPANETPKKKNGGTRKIKKNKIKFIKKK